VRTVAIFTAIILAAATAPCGSSFAAGLSITPGGILLQDVPVGEARSVVESSGISFVVHNRDAISHEYHITAYRPSDTGNGKWAEGYIEIPDAAWIRPVPEVLTIPAGESGSFDVEVELPDDTDLCGQKWAVTLAVESAPTPGINVALALYPAIQIETAARNAQPSVESKPDVNNE
jgi:hypothetical protein